MNRFSRITTAIMLASSIGLHWVVLQSVAWLGMLVTYSAESNFGDAVVKTFDGEHLCKLCVSVDQGKKAEKRQLALKGVRKIDSVIFETEKMLCPPDSAALHLPDVMFLSQLSDSPPTPPPQTV
jgi:hypothetical protein